MGEKPGRAFDEYLVVLSQAGSVDAFEGLARRWTPRLIRYAARMLGGAVDSAEAARDVAQETWLGVIRGLGTLRDPSQFRVWVYGIATRKCADVIRAKMRRRRLDAGLAADVSRERATPTPEAEIDLATAVRELPATHRAVVHLFYREELSVGEIAVVLGIPAGTVKSRLHNARLVLKQQLGVSARSEESHEQR